MIDELWSRIEKWASTNAPCMLEDLNPGASADEIAALELELGRALPAAFRDSLRLHNGETEGWPCPIFADFGRYLPASEITRYSRLYGEIIAARFAQDEAQMDAEQLTEAGIIFVEGPVKPVMYSPNWIPIMDFNGDTFWALDFDPAERGREGQVIEVDWEATTWRVVAPSFAAFLSDYVQGLESGEYRIVGGLPTRNNT
jgi:cell wall assembly regulator SMI1